MSEHKKSVFGIYKTRPEAELAVEELKAEGFISSDISVLIPSEEGSQEFAHVKGSKAPEGIAAGAGTGVVLGGALGWLVGIGALAIPGIGALIAAGPIVGLLAGVGVVGTLGGIAGALIGLGIPEYEAKRYEGFVKEGGILLSVHAGLPDLIDKAKGVLKDTGAHSIAVSSEIPDEAPMNMPPPTYPSPTSINSTTSTRSF